MTRRMLMLGFLVLAFTSPALAQSLIRDFAQLEEMIHLANSKPPGTVMSARIADNVVIYIENGLPEITSEIEITGGLFEVPEPSDVAIGPPALLFTVAPEGKLTLAEMRVHDWRHGGFGPVFARNSGQLTLRDVVIETVWSSPFTTGLGACIGHSAATIENDVNGQLAMERVTFVDSGLRPDILGCFGEEDNGVLYNQGHAELIETEIVYTDDTWLTPIRNTGSLLIRNSSFQVQSGTGIPKVSLIYPPTTGVSQAVNSVFDGFRSSLCTSIESLGHNTVSNADCGWAEAGDRVGQPPDFIWRELAGTDEHHLVPGAAGNLVDSADESWCPEDRLVLDGNNDGVVGCDRGAIELPPTRLADGGANGLFYSPDANGHYLYILDNDYNTLLVWNSFDDAGNQYWIYGTGQLVNGRSIVVDAYINLDGRFSIDGMAERAHAEPWGTLAVELSGCNAGYLTLSSDRPGFGSGQMSLTRLANVKQLGCVD